MLLNLFGCMKSPDKPTESQVGEATHCSQQTLVILVTATREELQHQLSQHCPGQQRQGTAAPGLAGSRSEHCPMRCTRSAGREKHRLPYVHTGTNTSQLCSTPLLLPGIVVQTTWQEPAPWCSVPGPNAKVVVCKAKKPKAWPHTAKPAGDTALAGTPHTALVAQAQNQVLG